MALPALKAGVVGGSFNNDSFSSLTNGGFSINGGRDDENNITVDGATAIRTRSDGAIVGVQNVDVIQEIQVLTGDYMPEYGRVEWWANPDHHEERQQPFQRERLLLLPRRFAAGQHVGEKPQREPARQQRSGPVRL